MTGSAAQSAAEQVPKKLTRRGIPVDPDLRVLAIASFANRFGTGAVMVTSALYFTRHAGFSPAEVALALSVAGICGLLAQLPAGHLGDTRGPRTVLVWLMAGSAAFAFWPALAPNPFVLAALLGIAGAFNSAGHAVRSGLIAQLAPGAEGVRFKAYLRAVTNTALGLGSLAGGLALTVDEPWAYITVFGVETLFMAIAAVVMTRLPHLPGVPHVKGEPRLAVARDLPFVAIAALTGLFSLHFLVMDLGLALYIARDTDAPMVMISVILVLNTAAVALFQVRMSLRSESAPASARALVIGACFIAVGFCIVAMAQHTAAMVAAALLIVGASVHVVGEMIGSGGQWGLQMGLAPHEKQGQYQAFAGLSWSMLEIFGPPLIVFLCVSNAEWGWFAMAGLILVTALATIPVTRWALATRGRYGVVNYSG